MKGFGQSRRVQRRSERRLNGLGLRFASSTTPLVVIILGNLSLRAGRVRFLALDWGFSQKRGFGIKRPKNAQIATTATGFRVVNFTIFLIFGLLLLRE